MFNAMPTSTRCRIVTAGLHSGVRMMQWLLRLLAVGWAGFNIGRAAVGQLQLMIKRAGG